MTESILNKAVCLSEARFRRPLVVPAVSISAGAMLGLVAYGARPLFFAVACAACFLSTVFGLSAFFYPSLNRLFKQLGVCSLNCALVFMAAVYSSARAFPESEQALSDIMGKSREGVEIRGVIGGRPVRLGGSGAGRVCLKFPVRLTEIRRVEEWEPVSCVVVCFFSLAPDADLGQLPGYGEKWELAGVLRNNSLSTAGTRLPVSRWAGSRYVFSGSMDEARMVSGGHGPVLWQNVFAIQERFVRILSEGIEHRPDVSAVLRAVLIGRRADLPGDISENVLSTGTLHVMAISGLHVGIVAVLAAGFLRVLGVSKRWWALFVAPVVVFYVMIAGMRPSAVRAGIMAVIFFAGPLLGRKPDAPSALALAAVIALLYNPFQVMEPGFLLSFITVAVLLMLCQPMFQRFQDVVKNKTAFVPAEQRGWLRKIGWGVCVFFASMIIVSSVAWMASAPLGAFFFNRVAPSGLIVNPLVIPLIFLIVFLGMISMGAGLIYPGLAAVFNNIQVLPVSLFFRITEFGALLPFGFFNVRAPPVWALVLWYAGLACSALLPARKKRIGFVCIGFVALLAAVSFLQHRRAVYADIVPVGEGCVFFARERGVNTLFNTGSPFHAGKVVRHLRKQGVNKIDRLFVTAGDYAAIGGIHVLLENYPVQEMVFFRVFRANSSGGRALAIAEEKGVSTRVLNHEVEIPGVETVSGAGSAGRHAACSRAFVFSHGEIRFLVLNRAGPECLHGIAGWSGARLVDLVIGSDRDVADLFGFDTMEMRKVFVFAHGARLCSVSKPGISGKIPGRRAFVSAGWDEFVRVVVKRGDKFELRVDEIK